MNSRRLSKNKRRYNRKEGNVMQNCRRIPQTPHRLKRDMRREINFFETNQYFANCQGKIAIGKWENQQKQEKKIFHQMKKGDNPRVRYRKT